MPAPDDTGPEERVLSAMAHPLRRRLLDLLSADGPATASTLARRTGQAVGNVSHHLRVLAAAEVIAEAPELARDGRERWWRRHEAPLRWSALDVPEDSAAAAVGTAAEAINLQRQLGLLHRWLDDRDAHEQRWRRAAFSADAWLRLTPAELERLQAELTEVMVRWDRREVPDDGARRAPVFVFARGFPGAP